MFKKKQKNDEQPGFELSEQAKQAIEMEGKVLNFKSFLDPDDLCNYINEKKIKPFSLNVTDRFYIVFYYEKQ